MIDLGVYLLGVVAVGAQQQQPAELTTVTVRTQQNLIKINTFHMAPNNSISK